MRRLSGAGVVGGIASGQAVLLVRRGRALRVPVADARIGDEVARLERARERSRQQIAAIRARLSTGPGAELAPLFDAQLLMLDDPLLVGRARTLIGEEKVNAEWAVQRAFDEVAALFDDIDDPYLRDRRGDVADVAGRVRMNLRDGTRGWQDVLDAGDRALRARRRRPAAVGGGPGGLVARDRAGDRRRQPHLAHRDPRALAGHPHRRRPGRGDPAREAGHACRRRRHARRAHRRTVGRRRRGASRPRRPAAAPTPAPAPRGPALTRDGTRIRLEANVDRVEDIAVARREHADGIGLFRSELLLNGDGLPGLTGPESERAQADVYRRAILAMAPRLGDDPHVRPRRGTGHQRSGFGRCRAGAGPAPRARSSRRAARHEPAGAARHAAARDPARRSRRRHGAHPGAVCDGAVRDGARRGAPRAGAPGAGGRGPAGCRAWRSAR